MSPLTTFISPHPFSHLYYHQTILAISNLLGPTNSKIEEEKSIFLIAILNGLTTFMKQYFLGVEKFVAHQA